MNLGPSCLSLSSAGISGVHHNAHLMRFWGSNSCLWVMLAGQTLYQVIYMLNFRDLTFIFTLISPTLLQQRVLFKKILSLLLWCGQAELYVCLFGC